MKLLKSRPTDYKDLANDSSYWSIFMNVYKANGSVDRKVQSLFIANSQEYYQAEVLRVTLFIFRLHRMIL